MKKKNLFLILTVAIIMVVLAGAWWWYKNFKTTDSSLANVKNKGVLVVGSDMPYGVMEFFDENNKPVGIDVDIAQEIASRLKLKLEFNDYNWSDLFIKVKNSEIDLAMSSITITPERQKEMLFSNPYFNGGQVIVVRSDNQDINGINNLTDKKIATQSETTSYNEAKKYTTANLIFTYPNFENASDGSGIIADLKNGKFEAIIVDYTEALDMIKNNSGLKIIGVPFTEEEYGIVTKIGNNSLIQEVNLILKDLINDGTLENIKTKWTKF